MTHEEILKLRNDKFIKAGELIGQGLEFESVIKELSDCETSLKNAGCDTKTFRVDWILGNKPHVPGLYLVIVTCYLFVSDIEGFGVKLEPVESMVRLAEFCENGEWRSPETGIIYYDNKSLRVTSWMPIPGYDYSKGEPVDHEE